MRFEVVLMLCFIKLVLGVFIFLFVFVLFVVEFVVYVFKGVVMCEFVYNEIKCCIMVCEFCFGELFNEV